MEVSRPCRKCGSGRCRRVIDDSGPLPGCVFFTCDCNSDGCAVVVRFVRGDSRSHSGQNLQCPHCNRLFEFPWIEWQWDSAGLLEVVDQARKGNQAAKDALLVILETQRKPIIFRKLRVGDVRPADVPDGHHDICLKVYKSIEGLEITHAYFSYEARIINSVCKAWRHSYRGLEVPLDTVFKEL
jgi:hypothetical protein